jgi:hypothetical protein
VITPTVKSKRVMALVLNVRLSQKKANPEIGLQL